MNEQLNLFKESDEKLLCGYFKAHQFDEINFHQIVIDLGISRKRVLRAYNVMRRNHQLITIGDLKMTVLACYYKGEKPDPYYSPAKKYIRDTYYKDIANKVGYFKDDVVTKFAEAYHLQPVDYEPENFGDYPADYDHNEHFENKWGYNRNPFREKAHFNG